MSIVSAFLALGAVLLPWIARGCPLHLPWLSLFLPLGLWAAGARTKKRIFAQLGFASLVGMGGFFAVEGALGVGLGVMGLAIGAWDSADLWGWRGEARELRRLTARLLLRSGLVAGLGCALAWGTAKLRLSLPFWGLIGLLGLVWFSLWAWTRSLQARGGVAKGNRSESGPMK